MLKILLVEDDLDLALTLVQFLELEGMVCDHASNGIAGLKFIEDYRYDVVLLDINMPRLDGLSVCQQLRDKGNDIPVLMLTARDQLSQKVEGFKAGSDDYLVKPFELEELIVRIEALSRRRSGQVQKLTCADLEMNLTSREVIRAGVQIKLSPILWKLLECLMRAAQTPVSRDALMDFVWGEEHPDSNSLKVHIFNLRKAVDQPFARPLIHTVSGVGFVLKEQGT